MSDGTAEWEAGYSEGYSDRDSECRREIERLRIEVANRAHTEEQYRQEIARLRKLQELVYMTFFGKEPGKGEDERCLTNTNPQKSASSASIPS